MSTVLAPWGDWFRRARLWWWWGGLSVVGLLALYFWPTTNDNVRRVGMGFETLGMVLVLLEVLEAVRKHKLQPPWRRFARYWLDIPLMKRGTVVRARVGGAEARGAAGRVSAYVALPPGASLQQRVELLEQTLRNVEVALEQTAGRVEAEERARSDADQAEAAARVQGDDQLREAIKKLEVGGLDRTMAGLVWLFVGMWMTTGTPELCKVLDCVPQEEAPAQKDEVRANRVPAWPSVRT